VRLAWPTEANEVFVVAPNALIDRWRAGSVKFHEWSTRSLALASAPRQGEMLVRLVTSFETEATEIDQLLDLSGSLADVAGAAARA
jgi:threonine aldolase